MTETIRNGGIERTLYNKVMNLHSFANYYGKFHGHTVSSIRDHVAILNFMSAKYETWFLTRMDPPENVLVDPKKPFLLALKAFFKSDVPVSVVCNRRYLWTVCLGNDRVVLSTDSEFPPRDKVFQLYATPYFVNDTEIVRQYLQGPMKPVYDNVFFYKNTILYLDNQDVPYPGGNYFKQSKPLAYHRICFLSNEPIEYVLNLALEWEHRQGIYATPHATQPVEAIPKFIPFRPDEDRGYFHDADSVSTGSIQKRLSYDHPEHLIQDILIAYYVKFPAAEHKAEGVVGLFIEWPFSITFEGSRYDHENKNPEKQFVALSVNGTHPSRVLYVCQPYDRYIEYDAVPAIPWTPVSFALSKLPVGDAFAKVTLGTVVLGVVYRQTFFCLDYPLLEGSPTQKRLSNTEHLLSTVTFDMDKDAEIQVVQTIRYDSDYSLCRVMVNGSNAWCLKKASATDPPANQFRLPYLVTTWLALRRDVKKTTYEAPITHLRLAMMLSKHKVCFDATAVQKRKGQPLLTISDDNVTFYFNEKVVDYINNMRVQKSGDDDKKTADSPHSECAIA